MQITDPFADAAMRLPVARIIVRDKAVATSGTGGVRIGGRWYSHIVDPRLDPVDHIADGDCRSRDADALATIFNVLPVDSLRLAERPGGGVPLIPEGKVYASCAGGSSPRPAQSLGRPLRWTRRLTPPTPRGTVTIRAAWPGANRSARCGLPPEETGRTRARKWPADFEMLAQFQSIWRMAGGISAAVRRRLDREQEGLPIRTLAVVEVRQGASGFSICSAGIATTETPRDRRHGRPRPSGPPGPGNTNCCGTARTTPEAGRQRKILALIKPREHGTYQLIKEVEEGKPLPTR